MAIEIDVRGYRDLEPEELDEWKSLARRAHPSDEVRVGSELRWAELEPETDYLIRLWDEGELRSCAWVTQQTVRISGRVTRVAGIRGLLTDPAYRRRGYGRAVMERAEELMRSFHHVEVAVLFSSVMAVPFYENLGWRAIRGPVTCEQPNGPINYTEALPSAPVMVLLLQLSAGLPDGPIEVPGPPW